MIKTRCFPGDKPEEMRFDITGVTGDELNSIVKALSKQKETRLIAAHIEAYLSRDDSIKGL